MTRIQSCRSCQANQLTQVLSLGEIPLANGFLKKEELSQAEEKFPLELVFCIACGLLQLTQTVPPEQMFSHYAYFTSFSETMLAHGKECVVGLIKDRKLSSSSLVIEIASNDGYLLSNYVNCGIPVLGIEPAANVADVARLRGIDTITEFFGLDLAHRLMEQGKLADVIHANNVLAHVPDINGFVAGMSALLKDDGLGVIEVPYLRDLVDNVEFDTIYHEHVFYFSLIALKNIFERHGLKIVDAKRLKIHGGSLRIFVAKHLPPLANVARLLAEEERADLNRPSSLSHLQDTVQKLKRDLVETLRNLKKSGKNIVAYGAAAKGSVLLNYFDIGSDILDFVVDRSTFKHGLFMPGKHLEIFPVEKLLESQADFVLLLAWNLADEIISQQKQYLERGGAFIVPLPQYRIVSNR
jgi:hypothetical protein